MSIYDVNMNMHGAGLYPVFLVDIKSNIDGTCFTPVIENVSKSPCHVTQLMFRRIVENYSSPPETHDLDIILEPKERTELPLGNLDKPIKQFCLTGIEVNNRDFLLSGIVRPGPEFLLGQPMWKFQRFIG